MKPRTIIGLVFIVASLTKLATIWGFIKWEWFSRVSEEPWVTYFCIGLLIYVGVSLIIDSYRRDPDQWLQRPALLSTAIAVTPTSGCSVLCLLVKTESASAAACAMAVMSISIVASHSTAPGSMLSSEASEWICGMQPLQRMKR